MQFYGTVARTQAGAPDTGGYVWESLICWKKFKNQERYDVTPKLCQLELQQMGAIGAKECNERLT